MITAGPKAYGYESDRDSGRHRFKWSVCVRTEKYIHGMNFQQKAANKQDTPSGYLSKPHKLTKGS